MAADSIKQPGNNSDYIAYFRDNDAYAFRINFIDGNVYFSEKGGNHGYIIDKNYAADTYEAYFEGRIWIEKEIISFWYFNFSDMNTSDTKREKHNNALNNSNYTFRETLKLIEKKDCIL